MADLHPCRSRDRHGCRRDGALGIGTGNRRARSAGCRPSGAGMARRSDRWLPRVARRRWRPGIDVRSPSGANSRPGHRSHGSRPKLELADESATRERLIDAAIELFAERGYANSTVRDLARSTGVTTGSIYGNFDNKATLLVAAIEARLDRDLEDLPAASGEPVSPGGLIMFHVSRFDLRARLRALLIEGAAAARSDPDVHERLRVVSLRHEERWVAECTSRLATPTESTAQDVGRFVTLVWCTELGLGLLEAFDLPVPDARTIGTLLLQLFQRSGPELFDAGPVPTAAGETGTALGIAAGHRRAVFRAAGDLTVDGHR